MGLSGVSTLYPRRPLYSSSTRSTLDFVGRESIDPPSSTSVFPSESPTASRRVCAVCRDASRAVVEIARTALITALDPGMVRFDRDGLPIRAAKPSDRDRSRSPPSRRDRSPPRGRDRSRSPPRRRTEDDDRRSGPSRRYEEPRGRDDSGPSRSRDEGRSTGAGRRPDEGRASGSGLRRDEVQRAPAPEVRYAEARPVVPAGMPAPASATGGGARVTRMIEVIANDRLGGKGRCRHIACADLPSPRQVQPGRHHRRPEEAHRSSEGHQAGEGASLVSGPADRQVVLKKWYTIFKDNIRLSDYEVRRRLIAGADVQIHDGMRSVAGAHRVLIPRSLEMH